MNINGKHNNWIALLLQAMSVSLVLSNYIMAAAGTVTKLKTSPKGQTPAPNAGANNKGTPAVGQQSASTARLPPASTVIDLGTEHLGGKVFSTGAEDVIVTIFQRDLQVISRGRARPVVVQDKRVVAGFVSGIYVIVNGHERFLGLNSEQREIDLGKLPAGELIFSIKTPQNKVFQTGPSSRNPDGEEHAVVTTYSSGQVEVWFEDLFGPKGPSDKDFNDAAIRIRGATDNGAVADLLKSIAQEKGEARLKLIANLKLLDPKAAAASGFK